MLERPSLRHLAIAARADIDPLRVQSALLAKRVAGYDDPEECEIIYCWVAFNQHDFRAFDTALFSLREKNPARLEIRVLTLLGWLWKMIFMQLHLLNFGRNRRFTFQFVG